MKAALVTVEQMQEFLGLEPYQDEELLQLLLDQVEAALVAACGRQHRPFAAAAAERVEEHDGTAWPVIWLHYPAASADSVVGVTIGADHLAPDETLTPQDLRISAGSRRLRRLDGRHFGALDAPGVVRVTYAAAADLPSDAALAVQRVVAAVYLQRGSEDVTSERSGSYSSELARVTAGDPLWAAAVAAHSEVTV